MAPRAARLHFGSRAGGGGGEGAWPEVLGNPEDAAFRCVCGEGQSAAVSSESFFPSGAAERSTLFLYFAFLTRDWSINSLAVGVLRITEKQRNCFASYHQQAISSEH